MLQTHLLNARRVTGPAESNKAYTFLKAGSIPHQFMNCADGVQIFQRNYFRHLLMMTARSSSSAFAILRQVSSLGLRFSFSMKLIVARLRPVISASFSCDTPRSFRTAIKAETTCAANSSDCLSLIIKDNQPLATLFIRNYSKG